METTSTAERLWPDPDIVSVAVGLSPDAFVSWLGRLDSLEDENEALRSRFLHDWRWMARYCWPERFTAAFNACHDALVEATLVPYGERLADRHAVAAPRGVGKSSLASFLDPLRRIVYGTDAFIVIESAVQDLAIELVADLHGALSAIEGEFVGLYGPFAVVGGKSDFTVSVRGAPSTRVLAKSFGQTIRGVKHRGIRPTCILIDDGERSDRVRSAEQRAAWWSYLTKDILKAGLRLGDGGTHYRVRGTVLHPDSMLATCLVAPGWRGQKFKSIIAWPQREDLWERCRQIWSDLTLGDYRQQAARAFYEAHRADMDAGVEVLDPDAEPIFALYDLIWSEGLGSFLSEKQNEPRDSTARLFTSEKFRRCKIVRDPVHGELVEAADGRRTKVAELRRVMRLDPIPGEQLSNLVEDAGSGGGDYAAIAVIGRDKFGVGYVLDLWMRRASDRQMLDALWQLGERWGASRASIESNGFARLVTRDFRRMQSERREKGLWWQVQIDEDTSTLNKEDRIARLEVPVGNGWLQFAEHIGREALGQFDDFPGGAHDDAPDAVEGAWEASGGNPTPPQMQTGRLR